MDHQSMKPDAEEAAHEPPQGPVLCRRGCGFFGSASTMFLCSMCYKQQVKEQGAEGVVVEESGPKPDPGPEIAAAAGGKEGGGGAAAAGPSEPLKPKRCSLCNKRVGYTGFLCRCGKTFCNMHRHHDQHDCPIDYKAVGQDAIAKANPVIKADKIDRI